MISETQKYYDLLNEPSKKIFLDNNKLKIKDVVEI